MAKKKKATEKVKDRGAARKTPAPEVAPESKEVLAKGHEWYDDGGNEGLKQRPI